MKLKAFDDHLVAAYRSAWRKRHCPPEGLLGGRNDSHIVAHLKICEDCRALAEADQPEMNAYFSSLAGLIVQDVDTPEPQPGEVWSLDEGLGAWLDEARYANAPLVLVLDRPADLPGAILVVQIGEDPELCGPGDVSLPASDTFAEAWNVYTLDIGAFALRLSTVSAQVLGYVREAVAHLDAAVEAEGRLGALIEGYRNMETRIGWHVHSLCLAPLVARAEARVQEADDVTEPAGWWETMKGQAFGAAARTFTIPDWLAALPGRAGSASRELLLAFLEPELALSAAGDFIFANRLGADGAIVQQRLQLEHRQSDEEGTTLVFSFPAGHAPPLYAAAFRIRDDNPEPQVAAKSLLDQGENTLTIIFSGPVQNFNIEKHLRVALWEVPPPGSGKVE